MDEAMLLEDAFVDNEPKLGRTGLKQAKLGPEQSTEGLGGEGLLTALVKIGHARIAPPIAATTIAANTFQPKCRPRVIIPFATTPNTIGEQIKAIARSRSESENSHGDAAIKTPQPIQIIVLNCHIALTSNLACRVGNVAGPISFTSPR